jgi:hypothetical protein
MCGYTRFVALRMFIFVPYCQGLVASHSQFSSSANAATIRTGLMAVQHTCTNAIHNKTQCLIKLREKHELRTSVTMGIYHWLNDTLSPEYPFAARLTNSRITAVTNLELSPPARHARYKLLH